MECKWAESGPALQTAFMRGEWGAVQGPPFLLPLGPEINERRILVMVSHASRSVKGTGSINSLMPSFNAMEQWWCKVVKKRRLFPWDIPTMSYIRYTALHSEPPGYALVALSWNWCVGGQSVGSDISGWTRRFGGATCCNETGLAWCSLHFGDKTWLNIWAKLQWLETYYSACSTIFKKVFIGESSKLHSVADHSKTCSYQVRTLQLLLYHPL